MNNQTIENYALEQVLSRIALDAPLPDGPVSELRQQFSTLLDWIYSLYESSPSRAQCMEETLQRYTAEGSARISEGKGYVSDSGLVPFLMDRGSVRKGDALLDLGCGPGDMLGQWWEQGVQANGIELIPAYVLNFMLNRPNPSTSIKLGAVDAPYLAFKRQTGLPDREADVVTGFLIMDRLGSPQDAVINASRLVRPGGTVIFGCLLPNVPRDSLGTLYTPTEKQILRGDTVEEDISSMSQVLTDATGSKDIEVVPYEYRLTSLRDGPEVFSSFYLFITNDVL